MTHVLFLITAYLFVGSLVMLVVNELAYGSITEREFVNGMCFWPLVVLHVFLHMLLAYLKRALGRG